MGFDPSQVGYPPGGHLVGDDPRQPYGGPLLHLYGGLPQPSRAVPPFVFPSDPALVKQWGLPHGTTSVVSSLGGSSSPLHSLPHVDVQSSPFPVQGPPAAVSFPLHQAHAVPPMAPSPVLPSDPTLFLAIPLTPLAPAPPVPAPAVWTELLKLDPMKDAKAFLDAYKNI